MFLTFDEVVNQIKDGGLLHIAGTEAKLRNLPKGNWIGGSTEYFMTRDGGKVTDDKFFVTRFEDNGFSVKTYTVDDIHTIATDGFENGFSILIVPFDSPVHREYAEKASGYQDIFYKNVAGWVSGLNLDKPGQTPIAVNGLTGEAYADKAVALHIKVPADKTVSIGIINIFEQDADSPLIEFEEEGFSVKHCLVDGKKTVLADYIADNGINTKLPLVGDYSGNGVNISYKTIENGVVNFYAPVFKDIKYRMAKNILDYELEFNNHLKGFSDTNAVFSCNCILNFLYGELEGKKIEAFAGPITFGEIAYQLVNQTLVYVTVSD